MTSMEGLALMFGLILCAVVAEGAVYWRSSHGRREPQDQQQEEGRACASEDRLASSGVASVANAKQRCEA